MPSDKQTNRRQLTLNEYVRRRNGVPLGGSGALRKMLRRSLGANSFTTFWQYWNPIFGYYLGKYIYRPARAAGLPNSLATILTFTFSGSVHDLAATLVKQELIFLCTPWFFLMAVGLLLSRASGMDLSARRWLFRATANLIYVAICLAAALLLR